MLKEYIKRSQTAAPYLSTAAEAIGGDHGFDPFGDLGRSIAAKGERLRKDVNISVRNAAEKALNYIDWLASIPGDKVNAIVRATAAFQGRNLSGNESKLGEKVFGNTLTTSNIQIVDGAGINPIAAYALNKNHNPAITLGNTVFIRSDRFQSDMSVNLESAGLLVHELTHTRQYQDLGFSHVVSSIGVSAAHYGQNGAYDYQLRTGDFAHETYEGQAAFVEDYVQYKEFGRVFNPVQVTRMNQMLEGSGIYGKKLQYSTFDATRAVVQRMPSIPTLGY